jgi:hypothetical protein
MKPISAMLACLVIGSALVAARQAAATQLDAGTMEAALHTTTAVENGFIERVLKLTSKGKLSLSMVVGTFEWARRKPHDQFQFFKYGLIARAKQAGINLR